MKTTLALLIAFTCFQLSHAVVIRDDVSESTYIDLALNRNGFTPGQQYPDFSPVGLVIKAVGSGESLGSGTLIGDRWVLTAAHVIVEDNEPIPDASQFTFQLGPDRTTSTHSVAVRAYYLEPFYRKAIVEHLSDEALTKSGLDIALLELAEPIAGITPAKISLGIQETRGTQFFFCGYGDFGIGTTGISSEFAVKRAVVNNADRVLSSLPVDPSIGNAPGGQIASDFDNPAGTTNTLNGEPSTVPGSEPLPYLGSAPSVATPRNLEGTPASGDSGGPAFQKQSGVWRIVGVSSFGNMDNERYGDISVLTRVGNYTGWILGIVTQEPLGQSFDAGNGYRWKQNLGYISAGGFPWYYHGKAGWLYMNGNIATGEWFYSSDSGWCYMEEGELPWAYVQGENRWRVFFDYTQ